MLSLIYSRLKFWMLVRAWHFKSFLESSRDVPAKARANLAQAIQSAHFISTKSEIGESVKYYISLIHQFRQIDINRAGHRGAKGRDETSLGASLSAVDQLINDPPSPQRERWRFHRLSMISWWFFTQDAIDGHTHDLSSKVKAHLGGLIIRQDTPTTIGYCRLYSHYDQWSLISPLSF